MRPKGKNGKNKKKGGRSEQDPEEAPKRRSQRKAKDRPTNNKGAAPPSDLQLRNAVEGGMYLSCFLSLCPEGNYLKMLPLLLSIR